MCAWRSPAPGSHRRRRVHPANSRVLTAPILLTGRQVDPLLPHGHETAGAARIGVLDLNGQTMSHRRFLIKLNRRLRESVCAVCGKTSELDGGPELFTSDGAHVCSNCGREAAPELTAPLGLAKAAEHYIAVIFESADRATRGRGLGDSHARPRSASS